MEQLRDFPISHGGIQKVLHPGLGGEVEGQTAIRHLRFMRPVRVDRLELGFNCYGRAVPKSCCHPAHISIETFDTRRGAWRSVRDVEFAPDPRLLGEGLSQAMSAEEMDRKLDAVLKSPPRVIDLGGLRTDHLRVICDREHPVWPNHGECNGGVFNVPFGILELLRAHGEPLEAECRCRGYRPILALRGFAPKAPAGMKVVDRPEMLLFTGRKLSIGFSMARPVIVHLGFDALGAGQASANRLHFSRVLKTREGGLSGPVLRTLDLDCFPQAWGGEVSVRGNQVRYSNLRAVDGLVIDAVFTVEPDRVIVELVQRCAKPVRAIEYEAWRLAWNLRAGITGAAGMPSRRPGRNGDVTLPLLWATDGVGALACRRIEGDPARARVQVESYRTAGAVTGGFVLAPAPEGQEMLTMPAGRTTAAFEWAVTELAPKGPRATMPPVMRTALRRHWGTVFSCCRPEFRGFSNHAASTNCHLSQSAPIEIAALTRPPKGGPDPLALCRFTVGKGLLDGGGYGYWRNLYLDSDPVLLCAAGRIHQAGPDLRWLREIAPGLRAAVERMGATIGPEGLAVCRDLSGNARSWRWSSNGMDVVGFGHIDGYVNALTYRAFRNAAALTAALGDRSLASRCAEWADGIRAAYAPQLVNPRTGWVAGWRSRDGELHDYAFLWVNGPACAWGLLDRTAARKALTGLERLRRKVGPRDARLGLPCNLLPIRAEDHKLPQILAGTQPTFETYTDGSLSGWPATYYLRALSTCGLKSAARRLASQLAEGYAAGVFNGGEGSGQEFRSWEGAPTGYEGTLIGCFAPLYALAIESGALKPTEPEWWAGE